MSHDTVHMMSLPCCRLQITSGVHNCLAVISFDGTSSTGIQSGQDAVRDWPCDMDLKSLAWGSRYVRGLTLIVHHMAAGHMGTLTRR
jgi:hypothetical protein